MTVVFDHALPNVPGKSMKGVLVEYGPGDTEPARLLAVFVVDTGETNIVIDDPQ